MIIYKTSKGSGYNPAYPVINLFGHDPWLFIDSTRNRTISAATTLAFIVSFILASNQLLTKNTTPTEETAALFFISSLGMTATTLKEKIRPPYSLSKKVSNFNIYTMEWISFFASNSLILMTFRNYFPEPFSSILSGTTLIFIALLFAPLAQLSKKRLRNL